LSGAAPRVGSPPELARWRTDTPGTASRNHLNNAGSALPPRSVTEVMTAYLEREEAIGGYEAADEAAPEVEQAYANVAQLVGAQPQHIAIVENATVAFALALSAFDFQPGDRLVTSRADYTSNQIMYLALAQRRGLIVDFAEDRPAGGIDPESLRRLAAHPRCRLVALTWIPTNGGLVQSAEEVAEVCRALGRPFLLDACQVVGQLPIDAPTLGCDFLSATGRKFLRGPRGIGFLYVSERALARGLYPLGLDMRGAHWTGPGAFELERGAKRFENWEFSYSLILGLGEAARYALSVGIERGGERASALAARLRALLAEIPGVTVCDRGERLSAIVSVEVDGLGGPAAVELLHAKGINASAARSGLGPHNPVTKIPQWVRFSPHYYNSDEEIEAAAAALAFASESARSAS
jgi:cysteine desulfurase/selenocysteine lyase